MKDMFNGSKLFRSIKAQQVFIGIVCLLVFIVSGNYKVLAVDQQIAFEELSEVNQLLEDYNREEAYYQLYELYDTLNYDESPELYLEVLAKIMLLEEYYWNYEGIVASAIELYELSDNKGFANYRMLSLLTLATLDYYNYDNSKSLEKLNEFSELQSATKDISNISGYYLGISKLMIDEQDLEKSRETLYGAIESYQLLDEISKINVQTIHYYYSVISDTYYYEEDFVSAAQSIKMITENMDKLDSEEYVYYNVILAEYYLEANQGLLAQAVIEEIVPIYESSSELFKSVMPWSRIDALEASIAYMNEDYYRAATMYKDVLDNQYDYSLDEIEADVIAQEAMNSFEDSETNKQLSLYEQLQDTQDKVILVYQGGIIAAIVFVMIMLIVLIVLIKQKKLLYHLSITDQLTSVYNRRHIFEKFDDSEVGESCVALIDLDNFKSINDTYGHLVGDEVLKTIATTINRAIRAEDLLGRYGGEEFILLLKTNSINEAVNICERVRKDIESINWIREGLVTTVSIGLVYSKTVEGDALLKEADLHLYEAKDSGKNQLVFSVV